MMSDPRARAALLPLVLLALYLASPATAGQPADGGKHALVRVLFDGADASAFLAVHPELDVVQYKPGVGAEIVATAETWPALRASGLPLEIVHDDLVAHYASRIINKNGNFGGWHTYSENSAYLDSLRVEYPQLISEKWSIGLSHQGNRIWCVRLSSDPDVAQPDTPEVLLITMIHAREIMSGDFGLMFADHLCRNYGTDPVVTWLMDNRELYMISIANPDGVLYNEQTNPAGGGMWRKNRRVNGDGSYGVDLNRNFPFEWVGSGSSTSPSSDTYRGPSPGSEPETQAIMNLVNSRQFFAAQDLHTYSNLTLYPWGYTTSPTPDAAIYEHMAGIMAQYNGYATGQPGNLLYLVNGSSNDWFYGATDQHAKIYAFCNEMGSASDGFWPPFSRRDALFQENLWPMLYLMMAAGAYAEVTEAVATDSGGGLLEPGDTGHLSFKIVNHGVTVALAGAELTLLCDDPYVQLLDGARTIGSIGPMGEVVVSPPLAFAVDPSCPDSYEATVVVRCAFGGSAIDYPVTFMVGEPAALFFDNFSGGTGSWTLTNQWGLASLAYSPPSSLTDSPGGNYGNNWNTTATLNGTYRAGELSFWHVYDLETGYDFGRVQVSADGGGWQTLASFSGFQSTWQRVTLDLSQYAGQDLQFRFLLYTDWSVTRDGWYIDDVLLIGSGEAIETPPPPPLAAPAADGLVANPVTLRVANVSDPQGGLVTYGFRIYSDPLLTQVVASADGVPAGAGGQTSWIAPTLADGFYWWRAYAANTQRRGLFGEARSFRVEAATGVAIPVLDAPRLVVVGQGGSGAELQLGLPQGADLAVKIYNTRGLLVRELFQGRLEAGLQSLSWDGRDGQGRQAAAGVYLVRAQIGDVRLANRIVVVR